LPTCARAGLPNALNAMVIAIAGMIDRFIRRSFGSPSGRTTS
jgi:hypothetical protein